MSRQKSRPYLYAAVCAGGLLALVGLVHLVAEWWVREPPNYSQIEDGLYLGGSVAKPPPRTSAVLNLCDTPDKYPVEVYRWEPIRDGPPTPDLDWLRQMTEFVDAQRRAGRTVFVHCQQGVSRSTLVAAAHLMARHGWTREQALAFIRSRRPIVYPNAAFLELLDEWERVLKEKPAAGP